MSTQQAIQLFHTLSEDLQKQVIVFIEFLANQKGNQEISVSSKAKRKPGLRKGFVKYMSEDFNAPIEDLKDYM